MRADFRYLVPVVALMVLAAGCAKRPPIIPFGEVKKVGVDPVAGIYTGFLRSEMERYGDRPEAPLEAINRIIKEDPDVGYFYYQRALINAGVEEWNSVAEDCKKALSKDSKNNDAKILLASALGSLDKHREAIRYLEEIRRAEPKREDIYPLLAKEYMNVERYRDAERVMKELLARDTEALVAYYYLGAIYGAYLKQPVKAVVMYERLLEREPENSQVIDAAAQLYLDLNRPKDALKMLLELEKHRPNDMSLKLKLARIFYKLKDYDNAVGRFEEILEQNPGSDKIMYYLGVLYEESGREGSALRMYEDVPPVSGLYKDARLRLAYNYKSAGEVDRAKEVLREAIRRKPKVAEFYQYLAGLYERESDYDAAIKLLKRATGVFPEDEQLFFALGTLYDRVGDIGRALDMMQEVLELNPKNASALNYIGYTYVDRGIKLVEAENMLQEAVSLKPEDGFVVDSLGWLYFKKGDLQQALSLMKRALKLVPNEPTILKHTGQIYLEKGDRKEALIFFEKALKAWQKKERVNGREIEETIELIKKAMAK